MEGDAFIEEHRSLVVSIATKVRAQFDLTADLDDLTAFGFRGLLEAKERFDASRGAKFTTFAYYRIRGAIIDGVRAMAYMPRRAHAHLRAADAAARLAEEASSARDTSPEARADLEATAAALDDTLQKIVASYVVAHIGDDDDQPATAEAVLVERATVARLRTVVAELPDRERALIEGFYFRGRHFDEVAEELGISKSWASRLHSKALDRMRELLSED